MVARKQVEAVARKDTLVGYLQRPLGGAGVPDPETVEPTSPAGSFPADPEPPPPGTSCLALTGMAAAMTAPANAALTIERRARTGTVPKMRQNLGWAIG